MRTSSKRWFASALALLALAGCGGRHERVIPWRAIGPSALGPPQQPDIPPIPRHARLCRSGLSSDGGQGVNSAEEAYYFRVRTTHPCALRGHLVVEIVSAGLPVTIADGSSFVPGYPSSGPGWGLQPGKEAAVTMLVSNYCAARLTPRRRVRLRLSLPAGQGVTLKLLACEPSLGLTISPFMPPELRDTGPTRFPLRARIEGTLRGRPGETLAFRVRLTNVSGHPYRFPYCPNFATGITGKETVEQLNCHRVGVLAPGEHVAFEMRHPLSAHLSPRLRTLRWSLIDDAGGRTVGATAPLELG